MFDTAIITQCEQRTEPKKITKKQIILENLDKGATPKQIAQQFGFSKAYVEFVRDVYTLSPEAARCGPLEEPAPHETLEPDLSGERLERYREVKEYRDWCFDNNIVWTEQGMYRFLGKRRRSKKKKNQPGGIQ